jgi:hypothetical protein
VLVIRRDVEHHRDVVVPGAGTAGEVGAILKSVLTRSRITAGEQQVDGAVDRSDLRDWLIRSAHVREVDARLDVREGLPDRDAPD